MDNLQIEPTFPTFPIKPPECVHRYKNEYLGESYKYQKHGSGLDVYVFPKKANPTVAFLGTRFGSVDNTFKTSKNAEFTTLPDGVAHFLEHKLFENEDGSDSFERFSQLGADSNAYTSATTTAYYFECTKNFSKNLEELIRFVFSPYFTEKNINKEIGIITEEIKMYEDNPYDRCYYAMLDGLYTKHSVKRNICGSEDSIKKITPEILYDCHKTFYSPSNMVLAVCGNVTLDNVMKTVDKFLWNKKGNKNIILSNENALEPREVNKKLVTNEMNVSKPIFSIGIKDTDIPRTKTSSFKKAVMMDLLLGILFSRSSEFYNELLERDLIYPDFRYEYSLCSSFAFITVSGKSDNPEKLLEEIYSYIDKLKITGLSREDFNREKKAIITDYVGMFDSTSRIANALFSHGCARTDIFHTHTLLESVRLSELEELLRKAFCKEFFTLSAVYPINRKEDL